MAELTVTTIDEAGSTLSLSNASEGGDEWDNNGNQFILVKNTGGESLTVSITTQVTSFESTRYGDATKSNTTLAIASGADAMIGPFPVGAYNDTDGHCNITYNQVSGVKVGVFEIQKSD